MATLTAPASTANFNFIECLKSNTITFAIAIYLIIITYYMTKDPDKLFTKIYLYATIAVVPIVIGLIFAFRSSVSTNMSTSDYIKYGAGFIAFILIVYFLNSINLSEKMVFLATGFIQLIIILMIIVALAIFYKIGYNYLYKMQGWSGFIVNLIFYIPCMLLDLLEYVKADLKQAPKAVYVLLIFELVLGLLYIYSPKITKALSKSLSNKDGKVVFTEPLTISNESRLSSYVDLQKDKVIKNQIINNKFAISAWVYIVPSHSTYNGDITIFEFTDYHPRLIYNGANGQFKAFFNQAKSIDFDMPLQKWNHVVFNYAKSNADIFINGELKGSVERDQVNENLTLGDVIVVGQSNGLTGGVCNMVYFGRPLLKYEIDTIYTLNKGADPPSL
jgi:hypothetical protein